MLTLALTASLLMMSADEPVPHEDLVEPPVLETGVSMFCKSDMDCRIFPDYPLCDPEIQECVECFEDAHCDEGWTCSIGGRCYDACTTDAECDGIGGASTCDSEGGWCVQCLDDTHCDEAEYCMDQMCLDDHCTPGEQLCFESTLLLCLDNGGSTMVVQECELGCEQTETGAVCVSDGSNDSGDGPSTSGPTTGSPGDTTAADGTGGASNASTEDDTADRGCACAATSPSPSRGSGLAWLLVLGAGLRRRRARRDR